MSGRKGTVLAITLSVIIAGGMAFLGPYLYSRFRSGSAEAQEEPAQQEEEYRPLTHDELLGPPLSFETPAYIRIPVIEVDEEVREGSDNEEELYASLELGPIHLPHTGFPGWSGNCVISGHRTTFTRPFNRLDELKAGDSVFIENPRGIYEYQVYEVLFIDPAQNVTLQTEDPVLTLTTCAPEGDATQRLVVRASLKDFIPVEEMADGH